MWWYKGVVLDLLQALGSLWAGGCGVVGVGGQGRNCNFRQFEGGMLLKTDKSWLKIGFCPSGYKR